jgi:hypothetical protein
VNRDPDERGQPDDAPTDDEFEAIVAGWRREGRVPTWPDDDRGPTALFEPGHVEPGHVEPGHVEPGHVEPGHVEPGHAGPGHAGPGHAGPGHVGADHIGTDHVEPALFDPPPVHDEEHFVPPEPPPLPPIGPPALVGLALVGAGLLLLVSPGWLGVGDTYGLPLGLVAIAAGLGWLVLRLWPDAPHADDDVYPDDGAVL